MPDLKPVTIEPTGLSEKTFEPVECLLCGPSRTRLIAEVGQFGWPTFVSICTRCGLVFLNPRWTKTGYDRFYASEYDQFYRFDEGQAAAKEQRKARAVWDRLAEHTGRKFRAALDIGCGLGWCLDYFRRQSSGLEIAGIEPSDYCAEHFTKQIGGELIARDVDSDWQAANQGRFDLIVFRHVLEHLLDPIEVLKKVNAALAPGGVVYIAVPDMMHPDGSLANFWYRCVHTYYYSEMTLSRIAARAGLEPVLVRSENSELWGIFRKAQTVQDHPVKSVYRAQMRSLRAYKRERLFRRSLLALSPRRLSALLPKAVKDLVPQDLKKKFRHLVYRH
jgi:2-polyprenyl-3-methyl-5-hydroxy-6-metoxy-1,4-benzoquinol methylase